MSADFSFTNETRTDRSGARFSVIKKACLGRKYALSLIFTSPSRIRKLNLIYRGKDKPTDILSFPLSANQGEIYVCPAEARKEARKFGRSYENFLEFLIIHGCVHLKGYDHGSTMERIETKLRKKLGV